MTCHSKNPAHLNKMNKLNKYSFQNKTNFVDCSETFNIETIKQEINDEESVKVETIKMEINDEESIKIESI